MLRRSRISVRPNVRPAGRGPAPASSQDTPPSQEAQAAVSEDLPQAGGQCVKDTTTTAVLEASTESTTPREDGKDPNGEASSSTPSAGLQRRKRFSVMPNLAKPRVAATPALTRSSPRTPKSPVKAGTETPAPTPEAPSQPDSGPPQGMRSPRRRPSGGSRQAKGQPKPRPLSPASPGPTTTSLGNVAVENSSSSQQTPQAPGEGSIQSDLLKKTPIIKVPSTPLEMVPSSSLPDKEGISVSERAKTLVARSVSGGLTGLAPGKSRLSRFLNDPTDLQRLAKARKLRELLRQEMNKEKKRSKAKVCVSEYTLDPSKMTMRDLIYYLPDTNPMTSYLVEEQRENETVLPLTPPREESPERPPTPEAPAEIASQGDEDVDEDEDDDGVMVPRVKVAEDGSLIIDEESLTVEVLRQKGPNPADDRDPIFERGSTTTYSSFRKGTHVKPWSNKETDMFFLAISMVGTDFSMIGQLFPHRGRTEIKNKFKKEERANSWRIDKAFKEKRRLDHEFFTSLLEKILAAEAKRNKNNKSPTEKIRIKKKIKQKEKKAAKQLSDVEEEGLDAEMDTEEVEGEKENENVSNEGTTLSSAPTPKRKRKSRDGGGESSPEEAKDGKKKKIDLITSDQEEAGVPEDSEAGPPESSKQAEEPVEAAMGPVVIKPAQLSRGRSQRPLPNLGRKWGQRGPEPNTKPNVKDGATPTEEENTEEGLSEEQVDKDASPSVSQKEKKKAGKLSSSEEEEEEASDKPIKPTRYGRIPKKTQLLNYPAKEDGDSPSDSAPTPASDGSPSTMPKSKPATRRAKIKPGPALPGRMGQSAARKSKLVTLRASQSEDEDEDEEEVAWREEAQAEEDTHNPTSPEEENQAPAFIPMSLRSPQPVATEVEETMEELDISVNVPDVLGISHDAFCPDSSCERAHAGEMGTVPCEHQLDLLVDVIDFLSPDNMEVSEESYNEAARTLLAIGNLTHLSQAAEAFTAGADDIITEERSNEDQLYQMTPQPTDQSQTSTIPSEYLRVTEASRIAEDSVPVASSTTASVPVTTTTASIPGSKITACVIITTATASVTTTTSSPPVTLTTTASIRVTTSTASVPLPQSSDTPDLETPPIEGPLRQMEGTDIGHASKMESGSEVSEGSEQQTTSQNRRSHFPKVKPNLGRAARTTQPKQTTTTLSEPPQTTTTLSEPPQTTTTLSEPPLEPMLNITTTSEPQPSMIITIEPPLPTESINTESETQPKQRTTTHSKSQTTTTHSKHQPTTNIIPHSGPQPSQRTRVAHSKPQPTLNTTTQSEPPQPTLNSTTNTFSKQQSTQSTTILSQPQPTSSLEQPGPVTLRPIVPESPLTSSEEVNGHDGRKGNTSSSLSAGGSQSGTSDSDQPKQTGPLTRRARLPKPKPNLGLTANVDTRSAVQVPESRPSTEVQTPEEADEVPMEIQQIHQVVPLSDIIDTTQEEIQQIHQVIPHPPIEGPLRQREGTDIGHASQVESGSEVSESSEQQTTSQSRRSHFPKVKPNLGRAARTTQPKQTTTTLSEPPQTTTTLSEPQPIQRTRVAHSKPQPTLNTTTQSEPPQPTLNSTTNTLSKQQSTQSTTILSQPQPTSSLEQPGPVTLRPIVPESPLTSSEEVKGHDGRKGNTSSSLSAGGSQSGTSDSDQPKQTGPPTRRARLPKPKPNLGCTAKAATCSAVQAPDVASRPKSEVQRLDTGPCPKVQTPEEADEVPMEIQQIHQVVPLSDIIDTTQEEMQQIHQVIPHPPIEGPLRQREGTDIGHASQVESGSEVSESSEQQTTSQSRRSHFPKVKPNLGRAARTTQPKQTTTTLSEPPQTTTTLSEPPQTTTTLSEPPQTTTTLSEPPLEPMLNITTTSEPQPSMIITIEPPLPTESINTESETQPKQRTTTHSKSQTTTTHSKHQPTTNIIPHSGPQPSQRTRVAHSKPQPTLNTTTQSEPPQPTLNSTTNTLSKQQSTQNTTILSQPQPTSSLEQPGPVTLRPIVPESPLTSSEEVKGHDGRKGNTSSSLSVGGSQSGTSDSDQPKQTGPLTRRARLPKPKPNLGCTAKAATRSAVQVPESRPSPEVQTPEEADEVPIEIQQIHQVFPLCDIIDTTQEEIQQIHQVIPHPPIEGPLRQREGTDIGHVSQVESGSEVSESSEQQTTSQSRRSHFPKVKPNLGRAARTTQPKQTTTTLSEPPQTTTTLSEPPQTTTTLSEPPQTTTTLSEPQPIQRTRGVHSKPQPALNTTTQSEPPQPTLNSSTNTLSKQQSTQNTTILSQPQPTSSLEQPGPVTLRPIVPESPLRSSEEVKGHDGPKENSSSSFSAGGSQSATSDSEQPKQTGPPTRRARLPKPKPNLGLTARAATRSAVQVPESRPSTEVQTPEEADEVPMEIQQIHQVSPLCDIIDTTQEEMEQIHQVISLTDVIDSTQGDMSVFTEGSFFSQQCDAVFIQHSETSVSTAPLDQTQSDPDEPIFILSLTEIPVLPAGEESGCTSQTLSEPFLFLPDAGTQLQQSSDIVAPGGGLEKGNAGVLCEVPEPMSVDEVLPQPSYTSIKEVESGSTAGPVGVCASAKPSEDSMADAVSEDTHPPKKRKAPERARRDKLQVRPNTAVREQTSCSAPAKEAVSPITPDQTPSLTTTTLDTYHLTASSPLAQPGPTVTGTASQQGSVGCFDRTETEHTPTGGEDNSSGAESQAARQITPLAMSGPLSRPGRRPRGFLSFMSNKNASPVAVPPRGTRAAARRPQVNTTRPGGKRAAPEPSTTTRTMPSPSIMHYTTTPTRATRTTTKPDFSTRVTQEKPSDALALHSNPEPSTSLCTTATESSQVPAAQPSASPCVDSGSADEEPINVSQYFFSDIFTEVEENEG
ncbi:mediator of DNA damage checkpoint protein 1-like isoform X2 [Oncorhynchus keta]|uniref:mediator of DNA damage checkpoint protein 1-like isoform X2 n=1 Tax=Oncorhynchus keta TaxID=8018 RepID=UPI00227B4B0D|nr:mediator of DNA damage checkpoint protein 1-like isoform X2 [Oncorhynchus keta]